MVDDLDDLLGGIEGGGQLDTHGLVADAGDHAADHADVDVGVEQGGADLLEDLVDVVLRQPSLAAQTLDDAFQP